MYLLPRAIFVFFVAAGLEAARPFDGHHGVEIEVRGPPKWPDAYEMEYTLTLPYVTTMQPEGLKYPVHVWWDGRAQRYRFESYGGMDSTGWDLGQGYTWNVYPRVTAKDCDMTNATSGPTYQRELMEMLGGGAFAPLPDISKWSYAGTVQYRNGEALVWQLSLRVGEKTANYQFYTARNGQPFRFYMMGYNLITGGHFDEYLFEFHSFKAGPIDASIFALPEVCKDEQRRKQQNQPQEGGRGLGEEMRGVAARLGMLLPAAHVGGLGLAAPVAAVLDELRNATESALEANARFVDEHNRAAAAAAATTGAAANSLESGASYSYSLSLNHLAHMTQEQWAATMLGRRRRPANSTALANYLSAAAATASGDGDGVDTTSMYSISTSDGGIYQRVLTDEQLPASVDWRGTGADGPGVKDQACCGSCWAFAATGIMQAAWFKATGQSLSFSEQQFLDCSWDFGNTGCAGGDVVPALKYLLRIGGLAAQEVDYPYLGQNGFCRGPFVPGENIDNAAGSTTSSNVATGTADAVASKMVSARFAGFQHVPSRDEKALMEVLALHGPVAVGIDGGRASFRFYSEGVYHNEKCGQDLSSLDHAVLLVGYGTTSDGVDYWLIKNSWSKYWGMDGYARVTRKGNDCGISTDAVFVLASEVAAGAVQEGTTGTAAADIGGGAAAASAASGLAYL